MTRSRGWCAAALAVLLLTAVPSLARADSSLPRPILAGLTSALGDLWQTVWALFGDPDSGHEMDPNGLQGDPDRGHGMDPDG